MHKIYAYIEQYWFGKVTKFHKHTEYVGVPTNIIHGPLETMFLLIDKNACSKAKWYFNGLWRLHNSFFGVYREGWEIEENLRQAGLSTYYTPGTKYIGGI